MRNIKKILIGLISFWGVNSFSQNISTITLWKDSAIGALWNEATATVAYGKPDAKGYYKIYLSDTSGNNERRLTYAGWKEDRHQWAEEWDPSGKYLFCYIEKADYALEFWHTRTPEDAIPGYGGYTDIWLVTRDGKQAWQLTNLPNDYNHGILHGAISQDGTMFAWTERKAAPNFLDPNLGTGTNIFKVADFVDGTSPSLKNIRTFEPGNVAAGGELESISNDKATLAFYSTFESKNIFTTPSYTLNMITGEIKKLTTESFTQAPTYTPDGKSIVYMTGHECDIFPWEIQGADWWIMNSDGSNKKRISFMNVKDHPQSVNHYRLAGSLSFISNRSFLGGVMTNPLGLIGQTVKVTFTYDSPQTADLNNISIQEHVTIFPNPCNDFVYLKIPAPTSKSINISILNIHGQLVLKEKRMVNEGENELFFNLLPLHLPSGIYFFKIDNIDESYFFLKN